MKSDEIKNLRNRLGMTQNEFGYLFSVTNGMVTQWEKGTKLPHKHIQLTMKQLANKLDNEKIGLSNASLYEKKQTEDIKNLLLFGGAIAVLIWAFSKD